MLLTEEEQVELGFSIIKEFAELPQIKKLFDYYEEHQEVPTEQDIDVTAVVLEYINNHYYEPTLQESVWSVLNDININESLYEELAVLLLNDDLSNSSANTLVKTTSYFERKKINGNLSAAEKYRDEVKNRANKANTAATDARTKSRLARSNADLAQRKAAGATGFINKLKTKGESAFSGLKADMAERASKRADQRAIDANNNPNQAQDEKYADKAVKHAQKKQDEMNVNLTQRRIELANKIRNPFSTATGVIIKGSKSLLGNYLHNKLAGVY